MPCLPVSEGRDDQPRSVSQVFVPVSELGVANVCVAIFFAVIPAMAELRLPHEGEDGLDLARD